MTGAGRPQDFDAAYYEGNRQAGDRPALWFYARVARRLAPAGARALDFGCGTGHLLKRLSRRFDAFGWDLSPHARAVARHTAPGTQVVENVDELPAGTFDLVVTLHVLEHVEEPASALEQFARLLRPGGRVLFVVPDPDGLGRRLRGAGWHGFRDPTHCSLLSAREWTERTAHAGLRVERTATDGLWDFPYPSRVPDALQRPTLGAPAALQVALGRLVLPASRGECLVVVARRP